MAGIDPALARDIARVAQRGLVTPDSAAAILGVEPDEALEALRRMEQEGLLKEVEGHQERQSQAWGSKDIFSARWFEQTMSGSALAMASFLKPMTRLKAELEMRALIDRALSINADPAKIVFVEEIIVIGSYANGDVDEVGDLDVIIKIVRRDPTADRVDSAWDYIQRVGAHPRNIIEKLAYPEIEAKKILRNRSGRISILNNADDYQDFATHVHLVFRRDPHLVDTEPRRTSPPHEAG